MSALITDAVRANLLKAEGYNTDLLEFIDMEHTPKNILIRAVKKESSVKDPGLDELRRECEFKKIDELTGFLNIEPTLKKLLENS